jgi:hypothetical protein
MVAQEQDIESRQNFGFPNELFPISGTGFEYSALRSCRRSSIASDRRHVSLTPGGSKKKSSPASSPADAGEDDEAIATRQSV